MTTRGARRSVAKLAVWTAAVVLLLNLRALIPAVGPLSAQKPWYGRAQMSSASSLLITGRVADLETRASLDAATVTLLCDPVPVATETRDDGTFSALGPPCALPARLVVERDGYVTEGVVVLNAGGAEDPLEIHMVKGRWDEVPAEGPADSAGWSLSRSMAGPTRVQGLVDNGNAQRAGLRVGDELLAMDGKDVSLAGPNAIRYFRSSGRESQRGMVNRSTDRTRMTVRSVDGLERLVEL